MSGWREMPLGEICDIYDGPHATPQKQVQGNVFLGISSLGFDGRIDPAHFEYVSEDVFRKWTRRIRPQRDDIVFSYETKLGVAAIIPSNFTCCLGRRMGLLRPKSNVYPRFLLYAYLAPEFQKTIHERTIHGSTVDRIPLKEMAEFPINVPLIPEQEAIASVLSSLDDKIDLLHRQNKTLEAMAETLFRQWFVEEAQEGWGEVELGSVVDTTSGGTPSRSKMEYYENGTINWVKSKELNGSFILDTEEKITESALKDSSAKLLPENSILIAMYGATVGEYTIISKEMACNQAVCALKPNERYPYTFLFLFIKNNKDELINMAVGSAQQNISQLLIKQLRIPDCHKKISDFHNATKGFFERIRTNIGQIRTLEKLRDTLLPKLMSGEVRVALSEPCSRKQAYG